MQQELILSTFPRFEPYFRFFARSDMLPKMYNRLVGILGLLDMFWQSTQFPRESPQRGAGHRNV